MTARRNLEDAPGPLDTQAVTSAPHARLGALSRDVATPSETLPGADESDPSALLASRARLLAAVLFTMLLIFAALDPLIAPAASRGLYWLKLPPLFLCGTVALVAQRLRSSRALVALTMANLLFLQLVVAPMTIFVGIGWHALYIAGAVALGAAAVMPWGLAAQLWLMAGLVPLGLIPMLWMGRDPDTVFPVVSALLSLAMAALVARQNERYHRAIRERMRGFRENIEHLRQVTEHIHGVFWLSELGGTLLYVSPRFEAIWGQNRQRLAQVPDAWLEPVHDDDRAMVAAWARAQGAHGPDICEYRLARADERPRWIRDGVFPIIGADGRPWRVARLSLDVTGEKEAAQERYMQGIARRTQAAIEEERKRFARDLHDDLGQSLTGIKLMLTGTSLPGVDAARIGQCTAEIDRAMASLRVMIQALRPPLLDELGLVAALQSHCEHAIAPTGVRCVLTLPDDAVVFSEEEKTAIFRIAQEALTNVLRHAGADAVAIRLTADDAGIELAIEDDGRGIDGREDFGVRGMRERAALLNGELTIARRPEGGTAVRVWLPRAVAPATDAAA